MTCTSMQRFYGVFKIFFRHTLSGLFVQSPCMKQLIFEFVIVEEKYYNPYRPLMNPVNIFAIRLEF